MDQLYQNAVLCENLFSVDPPQKKSWSRSPTYERRQPPCGASSGILKQEPEGEFFVIVCMCAFIS
jgi:hypothetical protein